MARSSARGITVLLLFLLAPLALTPAASGGRFHRDDPLTVEPETQDASKVREWTIDLFVDLSTNLFGHPGDPRTGVHAQNVNTVDEVPDSGWFTNRIGVQPVSADAARRGPHSGSGPAPGRWTVVAAKEIGFAPGFTMRDAAGETWFVSFDAHGYPEAATGAIAVATSIFWSLGYWQADNVLTRVRPEQVEVGGDATFVPMAGTRRPMRLADLDEVWRRADKGPDGAFRAIASRKLPGRPIGGFRYYGTRPDDPNDIVPHEHRRELRALQVFGAWTNLVDMKAGNTLDVVVLAAGRQVVRHYLQDVGSTFGTGANGPREYDEGWEHLQENDLVWKRLVSFGFIFRPWQTAEYADVPAIGRFEAAAFDPRAWKPRVPTAALRQAQPDDLFWAARRVAAFPDDLIRAIAGVGEYRDPAAAAHLATVLIERKRKIAAAYLPAITPVVNPVLSPDGTLRFANAAVEAGVARPPRLYRVEWARYDNATGAAEPLGDPATLTGTEAERPRTLPGTPGAMVRVRISADSPEHPAWRTPVTAYFRRDASAWRLIGLER